MLLPQSSAFAALKNRLNSVSSIGYLHIAPRPCVFPLSLPRPRTDFLDIASIDLPSSNATTPNLPSFDRPNRLKGREEGIIRWGELLEKFRAVQERARRLQRMGGGGNGGDVDDYSANDLRLGDSLGDQKGAHGHDGGAAGGARPGRGPVPVGRDTPPPPPPKPEPAPKSRMGLGRQFGRLGGAVAGRGKRA